LPEPGRLRQQGYRHFENRTIASHGRLAKSRFLAESSLLPGSVLPHFYAPKNGRFSEACFQAFLSAPMLRRTLKFLARCGLVFRKKARFREAQKAAIYPRLRAKNH